VSFFLPAISQFPLRPDQREHFRPATFQKEMATHQLMEPKTTDSLRADHASLRQVARLWTTDRNDSEDLQFPLF
jgi:hypothetical protein